MSSMDSEKLRQIFASNLNRLMAQRGVNQNDLVKKFGVTSSTASDWCAGKKYPRIDKVQMLADYFGVLKSDLTEEKPSETGGLDPLDKRIIELFGMLSEQNRQIALAQIETLLRIQDSE